MRAALFLFCGLGSAAAMSIGCRGRDLRVPPVPRYSDQTATAPGPAARTGAAPDPYGGLNPYADANLGSLPTVTEASPYEGINATPPAASAPYGQQAPIGFPASGIPAGTPPMPSPDVPPMLR